MLRRFLVGVPDRLLPQGEAWLIMSNLAELFGLRPTTGEGSLEDIIASAGLEIVEKMDSAVNYRSVLRQVAKEKEKVSKTGSKQVLSKRMKKNRANDPLWALRKLENVSLIRLRPRATSP